MKSFHVFFIFIFFLIGSCDCNTTDMEARRISLDEKEQRLTAKEDSLRLKEQELIARESRLDTVTADSTARIDSSLFGNWDVKMVCIETTCSGSAVGDTKIEVWNIGAQGNTFIASASSGGQVTRVYNGTFMENTLELTVPPPATPSAEQLPKMTVRVNRVRGTRLEGVREIIRTDCRIVYSMEMTKKSQ